MKKLVSVLLLLVVVLGIATTAVLSSMASNEEDEIPDYSVFEMEYLMNMFEHDGITLNGSMDIYNKVMTDNFFHRDLHDYLSEHSIFKGATIAQVQLYDNGINLISHPEHFYSVVLMDVLQSKELYNLSNDAIKSTVASNVSKSLNMTYNKFYSDISDGVVKDFDTFMNSDLSKMTDNQIEKFADSILDANKTVSKYENVFQTVEFISDFVELGTTLYDAANKINTLYAVAEYNIETIELLNDMYYSTSNSNLKTAIKDIISIYEQLNTPEELRESMDLAKVQVNAYTADRVLFQVTKKVATTLCSAIGAISFAWDFGTSLANTIFNVDDLNTGYLTADAAAVIEDALRSCMQSYYNDFLFARTAENAGKCRTAYRTTLMIQYYATNIIQKLGYSAAGNGSLWGAVRSLFGCTVYQDVVELCDSTRNIVWHRYYTWVGLAQKTYAGIYGVDLDHAISVPAISVNSVSFEKDNYTLFSHEGICNRATAYPTNAVGRELHYSSSNLEVAIVGAYGNITAVGPGEAIITATSENGTKATCKITVLPYDVALVDGNYTIEKYIGGAEPANIPSSLNGVSVTKIADEAFKDTQVTSAVIPDSVTSMGKSVFQNCTNLTSATIGDGVISIGDSTFSSCTNLATVTIGDSVSIISDYAFWKCESLTEVYYTGDIESWCDINFISLFMGINAFSNPMYYAKNFYIDNVLVDEIVIPDTVTEIKDYTFLGFEEITSVTIGKNVTRIGKSAFIGCESLTTVTIGDSVTNIGYYAFENCNSLTSITIPDSVTSIGDSAFYSCDSLTSIIIPDSVTNIGSSVFSGCTSLTSVTIPDSVTNIGYSAFSGCTSLTLITIPDSVTSIGDYAFYNCSGIKELTMPVSVKIYNSKNTFGGCTNIEKVTLAKGTGIMRNYGTSTSSSATNTYYVYTPWYISSNSIKEIVIEDGVTSIGDYVFYDCDGLASITIPDSVTDIGNYAFYNCSSIKELIMPASIKIYNSKNTFGGCTNIEKVTLTKGTGIMPNYGINRYYVYTPWYISQNSIKEIIIEDGVGDIGDDAFKDCTSLTSITIPDSVTSIGSGAFSYCYSLTSVTIPNSVTSIDNSVFYGCESLTSVTIPNSVTSIGNSVFYGCESLTSVTIPDSVTSIGRSAFGGCTSLTSVTIPDSVASIGDYAFYNCTSLVSVTIGNSVTNIGMYAFCNTAYYNNSVNWTNDVLYIDNCLIAAKEDLSGFYEIKDGTKVVADAAFYGCESLTSITIPDSVTSIGDYAFYNCSGIKVLTMPVSAKYSSEFTFSGCTNIEKMTLTKGESTSNSVVNTYYLYAPWYISRNSIKEIVIEDGVTSIGSSAFEDCDSLTSVVIPDSIISIGEYAFYICGNLKYVAYSGTEEDWNRISIGSGNYRLTDATRFYETVSPKFITEDGVYYLVEDKSAEVVYCFGTASYVVIPETIDGRPVTKINANAFEWKAITSLTIPEGVTSIGSYAFHGCQSLTSITIPDSVTSIGDDAFHICDSLTNVNYVGDINNLVRINYFGGFNANPFYYAENLYLNGEKQTSVKIIVPDDVTSISDSAFYGCDWLKSITIADSVTNIGSFAFYNCDNLTSITIPDSVISIGSYAFYNCDGLTAVTIPDRVTSIGGSAFAYCDGLTAVTLGDSVTSIGYDAFRNCNDLTSVIIGESVKTIDDYAFSGLLNLKELTLSASADFDNSYIIFAECAGLEKLILSKGTGLMNDYSTAKNDDELSYFGYTPWYFSKDSLKEIVIENGVTYIGENAFRTISGFTEITIPNTVTSIGDYAFRGCTGITDVYFGGTEEEWNKIDFGASNTSLTNATVHFLGDETGDDGEPDIDEDETTKVELDLSLLKILRGTASMKSYKGEEYIAITMASGKTMTGLYKDMTDGGTVELVDIVGTIQDRAGDYVAYQSQNKTNPVATMKVTYADGTTTSYPVVFELYEMEREVDLDISKSIRPIRGNASLAEDAKGEYILVEMLEGQSSVGVYKTTKDGSVVSVLDGAEGMFTEQEKLYIFYGSQNTFNPEGRLTVTSADGTQKTYRVVFKLYEMDPYVNVAKGLRPVRGAVTFDADGTIRVKMTNGQTSVGLYKTMANGAIFEIVDANGIMTNNTGSFMFYMTANKANVTAKIIFTLPDGTKEERKIIFDMGLASDPDPLLYLKAVRGTAGYKNDGTEDYIEVKANVLSTGVGLYKDCLVKYTITDADGVMTENDSRYYIYKSQNPDGMTANINFLQSDGSYKTYKVKFVF